MLQIEWVFCERKISGSVAHILKLCLLQRQTCRKNQISNMNNGAIRFPASFYKCLFPRISCLPQILNQTQNNRSHHSHLSNFQPAHASIFSLLPALSCPFCFSFFSIFQSSQSHLYFLQSPLHFPHTPLQVFMFLDLWRGEYKDNDYSDGAGGTMHWWVGWLKVERVTCEFFILYSETFLSGDSHISRHQRP